MEKFLIAVIAILVCVAAFLLYKEEASLVEFKDTTLPVNGRWQKVRQDGIECKILELEHGWLVYKNGITFVPRPSK